MKGIFLVALLSFTTYQGGVVQSQICGCGVRHPQVRYCKANFSAMIEIHGWSEANLPFAEPNPYGIKDYKRYNITVSQVFKPKEMEVSLVTRGFTGLWTSIGRGFCGKSDLAKEDYAITGDFKYVTNPDTGEEQMILVIDTCDIYLKMADVSKHQMDGLAGEYDLYCDSKCQPNDVYGAQELRQKFGPMETQILPAGAHTKYWSLNAGCFYNPVGSMHNLYDDCEGKFSTCKNNTETQECTWDRNPEFIKCFSDRGLAMNYREGSNAAAIQKPSDCKHLPSKKLKKECLRKLKKLYKKRLQEQKGLQ